MPKQNFKLIDVGTKPSTKKDFLKLLKKDKPNLIINITGVECDVSVDPDMYSEDELKELNRIVNGLSKNIWIDRTYVNFPGNRFKDAFMKEDGWYALCRNLIEDCFKRRSKKKCEETMAAILTVVSYYLYDMVMKMGYELDGISIEFKENMRFDTAYYIDERTSWRF